MVARHGQHRRAQAVRKGTCGAELRRSGPLRDVAGQNDQIGPLLALQGGPCVDDAVVRYLVDLKVPAAGTRCPAVAEGSGFGGIRDEIVKELTGAGVPEKVARCVVDQLVDELGEDRLNQLVLEEDVDQLTQYVTGATLACADGEPGD